VQILEPASHELVSGPPAGRRQFLDWGVFHVEPGFLPAWQRYRRSVQQRNAALKARNPAGAWNWDDSLLVDGSVVDECRRRFMAVLEPAVQKAGEQLLGAQVVLSYLPGWAEGSGLGDALVACRDRDLQLGTTSVGPHRADFRISVQTRRARDTVSRGQEKLVAAALTMAQVELVSQSRAQTVVLLLDEPGADLDRDHLARLLKAVADAPVQSFVTSLDQTGVSLPRGATAFHVERSGGAGFAIISG
jgi:DNA replication and repair protein RecF